MNQASNGVRRFDIFVDLLGFAVAAFFTLLFLTIVAAVIGAVGYGIGATVPTSGGVLPSTTMTLGIVAFIAGLIAVFAAYLLGGYTAGRLAEIRGLRNGEGVVLWTIVAAILFGVAGAIFGTQFNVGSPLHTTLDPTTRTVGGIISLLATLLAMVLGAGVGGELGEGHRGIRRLEAARVVPADGPAGQVRDLGDVVEIPIVEEVLVKQPVVKEVVRVRKHPVVEEATVAGDVRREVVQVEREGSASSEDAISPSDKE